MECDGFQGQSEAVAPDNSGCYGNQPQVLNTPQSDALPGNWCCKVCQKPTNQLLVLPCQHKFCERCLVLWAGIYIDMYREHQGDFPCQVCYTRAQVPTQGLGGFTQDFNVNSLDEELQRLSVGGATEMAQQPTNQNAGCGPTANQNAGCPSSANQNAGCPSSANQNAGWCVTYRDVGQPMCSYSNIHYHLM